MKIATRNETNELSEWQVRSLEIYKILQQFLKDINVTTYWAYGGTLIGAMREHGFIKKAFTKDHDMDFVVPIKYKQRILDNFDFAKRKYKLLIYEAFTEVFSYFGTYCVGRPQHGVYSEKTGGLQIKLDPNDVAIDIFWMTDNWIPGFYAIIHGSWIYKVDSWVVFCKNDILPIKYVKFETTQVPVPQNAEHALDLIWTQIYGNDWRIPLQTNNWEPWSWSKMKAGLWENYQCIIHYLPGIIRAEEVCTA